MNIEGIMNKEWTAQETDPERMGISMRISDTKTHAEYVVSGPSKILRTLYPFVNKFYFDFSKKEGGGINLRSATNGFNLFDPFSQQMETTLSMTVWNVSYVKKFLREYMDKNRKTSKYAIADEMTLTTYRNGKSFEYHVNGIIIGSVQYKPMFAKLTFSTDWTNVNVSDCEIYDFRRVEGINLNSYAVKMPY